MTENLISNIKLERKSGKVYKEAMDIFRRIIEESGNIRPRIVCSLCVKNAYHMDTDKHYYQRRTHFHGSEFGKCYRQVQLKTFNFKEQKERDHIKATFLEDGHLHEEIFDMLLSRNFSVFGRDEEKIIGKKVRIPETKQSQIDRGYVTREELVQVACHTDILLKANRDFVVEIKSVKDWFTDNRYIHQIIPLAYYGQMQVYLAAHKLMYGLLFFKKRHTSEILPPFVIEREDAYIDRRFQYLAGILAKSEIAEVVPQEYTDKNCDACKFCDFRSNCYG